MSNYDKMSLDASRLFLTYDQDAILRRYPLPADEQYIYVNFLNEPYRIDRTSGQIYTGDRPANFGETLSILDMVCLSPCTPTPTGQWRTLQQLTNAAGAGPVSLEMFARKISCFSGHPEKLAAACEAMGGVPKKGGEVSYLLPVFDNFPVWFQFWDADEEFPVSVQFLWDSSTPHHLHYETLWYIMGEILEHLLP